MKDDPHNYSRYEDEGVFFEPSKFNTEKPIRPIEQVKRRATPIKSKRTKPGGTRIPPQKSQFSAFYLITVGVSVISAVVIFAIMFNMFAGKGDKIPVPTAESTPVPTATPQVPDTPRGDVQKSTAVINNITERNKLNLTDLDNNKYYSVETSGTSVLKDRSGEHITFAELKVGDVVDVEFETQSNYIVNLSKSAKAVDYRNVDGLSIDDIYQTVTVKNTAFSYDENVIVTYKGKPYEISKITATDKVDLRGYANKIWVIDVKRGHGTINVINKDKISEGLLEIGNSKFLLLSETDTVEVEEGTHKIVVKGKNISPFTTELTVDNGKTADLDLGKTDVKKGELYIKCNVDDYVLSVNGRKQEPINPLELEQGDYTIKVEANGYNTWEQKVVIANGRREIEVELKRDVKLSKLTLKTEPSGADIYINNERIGVSPLDTQIEYGRHNIVAKYAGYNDFNLPITIEDKEHSYLIIMIPSPTSAPAATPQPADDVYAD